MNQGTMTNLNLSSKARTRMMMRALLAPVLMVGLLFFVAGRWDYWQAWVYTAINMVLFTLVGIHPAGDCFADAHLAHSTRR